MNFLSWLPSWVPWVGGGSAVALIALAVLAPSVLQVAAAWFTAATPLIKGAAEAVVTFVKTMWAGFKDMTDNPSSIVFVIVVSAFTGWMVHTPVSECFDTVRKEYKLTPRSAAPKVAPKKVEPSTSVFDSFRF